jgi:SAM-dependent methyltransferase
MTDKPVGLTRGQVRMAYRLILGRHPESEEVVDDHLDRYPNLMALRTAFLRSDEFSRSVRRLPSSMIPEVAKGYYAAAERIDYRVSPEVAEQLAQRIRTQWTKLGEADPYWSVLTDDKYRSRAIDDAAIDEFRASGEQNARLIDLTAARTGLTPPTGTCLELGCGVGRITRFLAQRFERVIAVDISPGNLALCERYLADEGVTNVETRLVRGLDDFADLPEHDFLYSMIVLQHNSPPVQYRILEALLPRLRAGGQCLFQTVADLPGYTFDVDAYLASEPPEMEVHCLPMAAVAAVMRDAGVALDLARMDPWVGSYGSYTFAGHRDA